MSDTKLRTRKATDLLREDHATVRDLFDQYEEVGDSGDAEKIRVFEKIRKAITVHAEIEEEIFYPAIAQIDDEKAQDIVAEAREEHKVVRTLIDEIADLEPDDEQFDAKMKVLMENVLHHAKEEEKEMFPFFKKLETDDQELVSEQIRLTKADLEGSDEEVE
jgi:hemerythrin superfamily protein